MPAADAAFFILNIIVPLIAGILFYLSCRGDALITVFVKKYFDIRLSAMLPGQLPEEIRLFVNGFAADMLWAYALTFACRAVCGSDPGCRKEIFLLCIAFEAGTEALQAVGVMRGTGDLCDVIAEAAATYAALSVINRYEYKGRRSDEINMLVGGE